MREQQTQLSNNEPTGGNPKKDDVPVESHEAEAASPIDSTFPSPRSSQESTSPGSSNHSERDEEEDIYQGSGDDEKDDADQHAEFKKELTYHFKLGEPVNDFIVKSILSANLFKETHLVDDTTDVNSPAEVSRRGGILFNKKPSPGVPIRELIAELKRSDTNTIEGVSFSDNESKEKLDENQSEDETKKTLKTKIGEKLKDVHFDLLATHYSSTALWTPGLVAAYSVDGSFYPSQLHENTTNISLTESETVVLTSEALGLKAKLLGREITTITIPGKIYTKIEITKEGPILREMSASNSVLASIITRQFKGNPMDPAVAAYAEKEEKEILVLKKEFIAAVEKIQTELSKLNQKNKTVISLVNLVDEFLKVNDSIDKNIPFDPSDMDKLLAEIRLGLAKGNVIFSLEAYGHKQISTNIIDALNLFEIHRELYNVALYGIQKNVDALGATDEGEKIFLQKEATVAQGLVTDIRGKINTQPQSREEKRDQFQKCETLIKGAETTLSYDDTFIHLIGKLLFALIRFNGEDINKALNGLRYAKSGSGLFKENGETEVEHLQQAVTNYGTSAP